MQFLDKVCSRRLLSGHPCCGAEAVPHGPALHAHGVVQFSDKVVEVPVVVQRQVPQFRSCSSSRSSTPLFLRSG